MKWRRAKEAYFISFCLYSEMRARNGISQAKNLITFIPPSNSCRSFARLSVHSMLRRRSANSFFITYVCAGVARIKNANPASAEGPRLMSRSMRQIIIWIGAVHAYGRCHQPISMCWKRENTPCGRIHSKNQSATHL